MQVMELGGFIATNLGVFNAINADGGGSTTLALATPQPHLVNFPSSGPSGRAVGANLAVFALPAYVEIANIPDGSTFTAPSEIDITADVLDRVGTVTNVAFYASGSLLGAQASGPFMLAWHNPPGGSYRFQAVAMDNAGLNTTSGVVNISVTCSAQPGPPANVAASDGAYCGVVQVSWSPSNGATGYNVSRDGSFVANVGAPPYNDVPGDAATHSYAVTGTYNCGQSAAGAAAIGYAVQVPPPPAGVSASAGTYCGVVRVSWTSSSGAASYNLYRDGALVRNVAASPYTDTPGDTANHLYTVAAGNACGTSVASAPTTGYAEYCPGDFSMTVSPLSRTVLPGTAANYSVTVTASGRFGGTVTFSVTGLPNDATQTFSHPTVMGSGSTALAITAPLGTYTLTITGTSGSLVHQVIAKLVVSDPDFSVVASPASRTVTAGKSTTYTAKYTPILGFSGTVTWSVSGLPIGVSGTFTPSGTNTDLLTVNSAKTTQSGTYTLTVAGTSGAPQHSTTVSLIVR
jgi:Phosphodiester glycosidase